MSTKQTDKFTKFMQKTVVVWIGAMICCFLWGSALPCIKIGYDFFDISESDIASQIVFAGSRFILAGILAIAIGSILQKKFIYPRKQAIGKVVWLSCLQTIFQYILFYIGVAHTTGVKASVIEAVHVFVAIIVASLFFHLEKITARKIIGCAVGFAGVILVNLSGFDLDVSFLGEGFVFLSTIAYAFSSVFMKSYSKTEDPIMLSGYQFIVGGIVMSLVGILCGGRISIDAGQDVIMLLYLAFISAVAYSIWGMLLKYNPLSKVAIFGFMNPVFGFILSAIFLGELNQAMGLMSIVSLILVCIGILIVNKPTKESNKRN